MTIDLHAGDCREVLAAMPDESVDAVVTDPPYELGFMGKKWDGTGIAYDVAMWAEVLRVLKPGGHLLSFGGTRTWHRMACAVEDAGFEMRDSISYQHMKHVFCQCSPLPYSHGSEGAAAAPPEADDDPVRGVRSDVRDPHVPAQAGGEPDVLAPVQREAPRGGVGEARSQGPGGMDGRDRGSSEGEDEGGGEPVVEGRGDLLPQEGQLRADQVRAGAGVGEADGPEGRLHHGAPAPDGDLGGAATRADGGGASRGPRPDEQRAGELGALAVEWIAQGGGAWPGCPRCHEPLAPPFDGGISLTWNYGSGFPKSLDVGKAIDKAAGAEREVVGAGRWNHVKGDNANQADALIRPGGKHDATAPATPDAVKWDGWGTALKPAHEPIVVARKPFPGTVAANVVEHGTGALNIDGCRIGTSDDTARKPSIVGATAAPFGAGVAMGGRGSPAGRWPANVVLDDTTAAILDEQSGTLTSGRLDPSRITVGSGEGWGFKPLARPVIPADSGGASRFFYCAKAPTKERPRHDDGTAHPTVKPLTLMRWLVRLVTPPDGTILEPFAGSGTTLEAALLEGFHAIGIEANPDYLPLIRQRLARHDATLFGAAS